jgi:hypothetical protein
MRQLADCIVPWRGYNLPLAAEAEGNLFHLLGLVNGAWFGGGHGGGLFKVLSVLQVGVVVDSVRWGKLLLLEAFAILSRDPSTRICSCGAGVVL